MRRRDILTGLVTAAGWALPARSQSVTPVRIGYLSPGWPSNPQGLRNQRAFREGLAEFGRTEGASLVIEYRHAEARFERLPELAADLVRANVAVIVAGPTPAAVAARQATRTIPIVMVNVGDPVGLGLVESLAAPGGNVTGLAFTVGTETFGKGLELFKDAVPGLRRVAVLGNPGNPGHPLVLAHLQVAARDLGLALVPLEAAATEAFEGAFRTMAEAKVDGLYVIPDVLLVTEAPRLTALAAKHRLPTLHQFREEVEAGGLMSYGHSNAAPWRRAAAFVDQILKGARPADLPVQQPTQFEFVVNLRTARALGLDLPPALLARADEVIE